MKYYTFIISVIISTSCITIALGGMQAYHDELCYKPVLSINEKGLQLHTSGSCKNSMVKILTAKKEITDSTIEFRVYQGRGKKREKNFIVQDNWEDLTCYWIDPDGRKHELFLGDPNQVTDSNQTYLDTELK